MPRPIWSGSISFGLVNVPVRLFNAVRKKAIRFHQLRAGDGCRIRLKKVCSADNAEVAAENIVKGYEIAPDRHVIVSTDELQALAPEISRTIAIEDFVLLSDIDPLYYESSYYAVPDKGAARAYSLLLSAMKKAGKVAIARFVLRNKEYLAALRPTEAVLSLSTMHFKDEIVAVEEIEGIPEAAEPAEREMAMAEQLIASLSTDFTPDKYRDEYYGKVMEMIERKAEGQQLVTQPSANEGAKVIDLMAALEASLAGMPKKAPVRERRKKARAQ